MKVTDIYNGLKTNSEIFKSIFSDRSISITQQSWKPDPTTWCLKEILCHLLDEESEDFKVRIQSVVDRVDPPPIDPVAWVLSRQYISSDYSAKLNQFLLEREQSLVWLHSNLNLEWDKIYTHSESGTNRSAKFYLENWLAHDYLHIRQATKIKYLWLKNNAENKIEYAGNWVI